MKYLKVCQPKSKDMLTQLQESFTPTWKKNVGAIIFTPVSWLALMLSIVLGSFAGGALFYFALPLSLPSFLFILYGSDTPFTQMSVRHFVEMGLYGFAQILYSYLLICSVTYVIKTLFQKR